MIRGETNLERVIVILLVLTGYLFHVMILNSALTSVFIKKTKYQFEYKQRLHGIMELLKNWEIPENLQNNVWQYYNNMWIKRHGCKEMPEIFSVLPKALQKEITVDIFWEALRHSHIFSNMDMPMKRAISSIMKSEFYLNGDLLLGINDRIHKMYYISSGIVQVNFSELSKLYCIIYIANGWDYVKKWGIESEQR